LGDEPSWLHELRGTLAAVRVWSEVLRQARDDAERTRALERIELGVASSQRLLDKAFVPAATKLDESLHSEDEISRLDEVNILVIEDDPDLRNALAALLAQLGARVDAVASAEAALDQLERKVPNVILCDVHLPGEGGVSFLRTVRARPGKLGATIPAIALTAAATAEVVDATRRVGFDLHLVKPPRLSDLTWALARLARRI